MEERSSFYPVVLGHLDTRKQKVDLHVSHTSYTDITSKCIVDLNVTLKATKLLENIMIEDLWDTG